MPTFLRPAPYRRRPRRWLPPSKAAAVGSGDGASSVTFTASGVAASSVAAVGAAAVTFTPAGVAASSAASVGAAAVVFSPTGVAASTAASVGAATVVFSPSGVGASTVAAVGSASVTFSANGVAGGDETAPLLSNWSVTPATPTTATLFVTTDEANGTLYAVVTASATPPTALQIRNGQDENGAAATFAGSQAISSTGQKSITATGLTPAGVYYAYFVHRDGSGNDSLVAATSSFTQPSPSAGAASFVFTVSGIGASRYAAVGTAGVTFSVSGVSPPPASPGIAILRDVGTGGVAAFQTV